MRCPSCGEERLVAFSCKGRICPSCSARRAADIAADLADRVLPEARYRQYVLTFPWPLRLPLAFDAVFFTRMIGAYLHTLMAWMRRRGRAMGIRGGRTGAVTFVQRFGGALNVNPHLHSLLPDGLFVGDEGEELRFVPMPPPTQDEIARLTASVASRLIRLARRILGEGGEPDAQKMSVLASLSEAMVPPLCPAGIFDAMEEAEGPPRLCANVEGYCLHAARTVSAGDRAGLERLCRYGLRAPFSQERLTLLPDGRVRYRLRRPWPTPAGVTELVLDPIKFLRRLCALIPNPGSNLVRYHGIFASRSRDRARLPAPPCSPPAPEPPAPRKRRTPWAQLLMRVLSVDALTCPRCSAPIVVLAFITDPGVLRKILEHLGLPSSDPPRGPSRFERPEEQVEMFEGWEEEGEARAGRDPPWED